MLINYEGELRSPTTGDPVPDGTYDMRFRIYDVQTGGTHLWEENHSTTYGNAVEVAGGIFSVLLGSGTGDVLNPSIFSGSDRWLEITVETETMSPRQRITSSAYSIICEDSRLLDGNAASAFAEAGHAHSGTDITSGAVAEGRIDATMARDAEIMPTVLAADGTGSTLDADRLDGKDSIEFAPSTHDHSGEDITAGTVPEGRIDAIIARDTEVDSQITSHAGIADAHHVKTTSFSELTGTLSEAQIPPTIARDSEVSSEIIAHEAAVDAHHPRYADSEAVAAMGATSDTNPLNHDKTTSFSELTGTLLEAQIPASIARDSEVMPVVLGSDGPGSTLNADVLDGVDSTGFAAVGHTHAGDFWALGGNGGTSPGIDFVGTTDNQAVELRVNGARALRVEPGSTPSLIGGYAANTADAGVVGASIGGGGETGSPNRVTDDFGTVGGGGDNRAGNNDGTTDDATYATVGGGQGNTAGYVCATVGGGFENTAQVEYSFVGGGIQNLADSHCSTVGGGARNSAGRDYATVGGGQDNIAGVFLSGENATVPGGRLCFAVGDYSFAAGRRAKADHKGAFVWGDSQDADIHSTQDDQVTFRCLGGVRFTSGSSGANQEVSWAPGDSSWTFSSDRDLKENFVEIDPKEVLDRISRVSITEWNFKGYSQRHIGPMAQDFHALFALGGSDTMIDSGDLQGVSLAAIQGLHEIVKEKDAKISSLESRIEALETFVKKLAESQAGGEE